MYTEEAWSLKTKKTGAASLNFRKMVGRSGIEPLTSTMSM